MKYFVSLNTLNAMQQFVTARSSLRNEILLDHLTCELRRNGASRTQASRLVNIHAQLVFRNKAYASDLNWFVSFHKQGLDIYGVTAKGFGRNNLALEDFVVSPSFNFDLASGRYRNLSLVNSYYDKSSARIVTTSTDLLLPWELLPFSFAVPNQGDSSL